MVFSVAAERPPSDAPRTDREAGPDALDRRAVRRAFGRAAATYAEAAVLQREVGARMAARLDVVKLAPAVIVDAGCGTGGAQRELAARYPDAHRVALDLALPMLDAARGRGREPGSKLARLAGLVRGVRTPPPPFCVCGDIAELPFAHDTCDLLWSNLALQWVSDLPRALGEFRRVLKVGGLASFTTFGPDTLKELRAAFAGVDRHTHVSRFVDMHDIGDLLVQAGFADPVMDMEYLTLTYADGEAMMRDLRAIGATNATAGRPRGLTGRGRWRRTQEALEAMRRDGRIPATFEVIYGHAWKVAAKETAEGLPIVRFASRPSR
jgi:malonyl-CoA O-methyltransferase